MKISDKTFDIIIKCFFITVMIPYLIWIGTYDETKVKPTDTIQVLTIDGDTATITITELGNHDRFEIKKKQNERKRRYFYAGSPWIGEIDLHNGTLFTK